MSNFDCLHVGLHKCGSSLFQNHIFPKHPEIELVSGRSTSEKAVNPNIIYKFNTNIHSMAGTFEYEEAKTALRQAASQFNQDKTIVLSNESYSGDLLTGRNAQTKAKILADLLRDDIKVIVTVRDQYEYISSAWREYVRAGGVMSLNEFLTNYHGSPAFSSRFHSIYDKIQYHNYLDKLYNLFGRDNVKLMFLEELNVSFQDFVSSIYDFLNVDPIILESTKENVGLGYYESTFLRFFNMLCKGSYNQAPMYIFPNYVQSKTARLMTKVTRRRKNSRNVVKNALPQQVEILTNEGIKKENPSNLIKQSNKRLSKMAEKEPKRFGYDV